MKKLFPVLVLSVGLVSVVSKAQIAVVKGDASSAAEVSVNAAYTQNFNSLPSPASTKSDKAEPLNWKNNVTLRGWFRDVGHSKGDYSASGAYVDAPAFFNYGLDGNPNRSVGFRNTQGNERDAAVAIVFLNETGAPIKGVKISYTGRQWRRQSEAATTLVVGWRFFGKDFNADTFTARQKQWWTDVPALTFTAPQLKGSNVVNGMAPECMKKFPPTEVIFRRGVYPGEYFSIRWYYPTDPKSTGNGLAVDDVVIEFIK